MKCPRENRAIPGGLGFICHPTQDSACGCVLGYHDAAPTALDFRQSHSAAEVGWFSLTLFLTHTLKSGLLRGALKKSRSRSLVGLKASSG